MSLINCCIIVSLVGIIHADDAMFQAQKVQSYQKCRTDRDCKENSFCYDNDDDRPGKCKCLTGFELIRNSTFYECLAWVSLGEACEKDIQCNYKTNQAFCNDYKICACDNNSHVIDGVCYATIKLGDICQRDEQCYTAEDKYATCADGRCSCRDNEMPSVDRTRCIRSQKLGHPCTIDEECASIANTVCLEKCQCATEYTLSRNETYCIKAATKFLDPCEFDGQCSALLQQSVCIESRCGCSSGYHDYGNRCALTKHIGERCEDVAECVFEKNLKNNVECQKGVCSCIFGITNGACKIEKLPDELGFATNQSPSIILVIFVTVFLFYSH